MTVLDTKNKKHHTKATMFLDPAGGVSIQRFDTIKYKQFDKFTDRLLQEQTHEVKIVEDFSELDASNVSDEIVENAQDTTTSLMLLLANINLLVLASFP